VTSSERAGRIIVAIDGPAGAGKSTIARHLARHFGLLNLESGAMYRAFALKALRAEIPLGDSAALEVLADETNIRLEPGEDDNRVLLDDEDVTGLIRNQTVTDAASRVSVFPPIRAWMVRLQQQLGDQGGVVMEGRDIGTNVFPETDFKFYLDASLSERKRRRLAEGVHDNLAARDERDSQRAAAPLMIALGALFIDTSTHTPDQTNRLIIAEFKRRLAERKP